MQNSTYTVILCGVKAETRIDAVFHLSYIRERHGEEGEVFYSPKDNCFKISAGTYSMKEKQLAADKRGELIKKNIVAEIETNVLVNKQADRKSAKLEALIRKLHSPFHSRIKVTKEIAKLGKDGEQAIPQLIRKILVSATKCNDEKKIMEKVVNGPYAQALFDIGSPSIDYLLEKLVTGDENQRYALSEIVARFGESAIPKLISLLKPDTPDDFKTNILWTINSIGFSGKDAVPVLKKVLTRELKPEYIKHQLSPDTGNFERIEIREEEMESDLEYLRSLRTGEELTPFELKNQKVIVACIETLGTMGVAAKSAKPVIEKALKIGENDILVKLSAERALRNISK